MVCWPGSTVHQYYSFRNDHPPSHLVPSPRLFVLFPGSETLLALSRNKQYRLARRMSYDDPVLTTQVFGNTLTFCIVRDRTFLFQLIKDLLPISERASISWPVTEQFLEDTVAPFVSYWPSGRIEDVSISAQVVGVDTTYGFPRICDQTPAVRIFPEDIYELSPETTDNKTIHLKAKCFEVTITVTKHMERCPWCPDPHELLVSNEIPQQINLQQSALESGIHSFVGFFYKSSTSESLQVGIVLLASLAFFSMLAFSIMLTVYLKSRK